MKIDDQVVEKLNGVLVELLTTINQTFLHARIFQNWGIQNLNEKVYKESIRQMKAADKVIHRILFLEGLPNLQDLGRLNIGEDAPEMIQADLDRATKNVSLLKDVVAFCEQKRDFQTREMLEDLLGHEEEHLDFLETQQHLIQSIGLENYLAERSSS
jgi:bacterioferritin